MLLRAYEESPVRLEAWDPRTFAVAARLIESVRAVVPDIGELEHVGSSSVPELHGKNIVDLAAHVLPVRMSEAVRALVEVGWQRQTGPRAHPDERPMLRASVEHEETLFRTHLHLLPHGGNEWPVMIAFRDALRTDEVLRARYVARKREVLAAGIDYGPDYAQAKSDVVLEALRAIGALPPA